MVDGYTVMTKTLKRISLFFLAILITISLSFVVYSQTSSSCPIAAYEGDLVKLNPAAFDPDPEIGPAGKLLWAFGSPFDSTGKWQTRKGQRGIFNFWVSVSDGELKDTNFSCVEILPNNRNPVLAPVQEITITRGQNTEISATCTDPDGDPVSISYRFNGKDVAYILYEPPGTYNLDVTCTDGFGGVDSQGTKLHIVMPAVQPKPKPTPATVIVAQPKPDVVELLLPKPASTQTVELVLPKESKPEVVEIKYPKDCPTCKPSVVEVRYPKDCKPCAAKDNIEVVVYDSAYPLQDSTNTTSTFVLESAPVVEAPKPAEAPKNDSIIIESDCEAGNKRKEEISRAILCC